MAANCKSATATRTIYEAISVVLKPRRFVGDDIVGDGSNASTSISSAEDKKDGDNKMLNKEEITAVSTSHMSLSSAAVSSSSVQEVPTLDPNDPIRTTTPTETLPVEAQEDANGLEIESATSTSRASLETMPASTISENAMPVLDVSDPVLTNQTINNEEQAPIELGQDNTVSAADPAVSDARSVTNVRASSYINRLFRSASVSTESPDETSAVKLSFRHRIVSLFRLRRLPSMTRWAKWAFILAALTCTAILTYALFQRNAKMIKDNVDGVNDVTEEAQSSTTGIHEIEHSQSVSQSWWSTGRQVCNLERERMRITAIRDGFERYERALVEAKYN